MKSPLLLPAAATLLALAACNNKPAQPEVVDTNPDPMATQLANRAPVELPPAIKAEKTFRCKDNSLVYVTFFEGDKQALVRTEKAGSPTRLTADKGGDPLTATGGWKLTGNPSNITLTRPGKDSLTCKS
ncbi:hypothetical protein D9601_14415 [Sphingomonas sp. MA1305]|uniref:hypothetical protein n=1 Tax=unclassified Sphingomonas TaxID=196159 RepID=UPI0018DF6924|nr:hypothetical protein [Sphingomonas sp. MA1305]MBI0476540.1 hypothetical protein [Sphingomonas sp. MA1305]